MVSKKLNNIIEALGRHNDTDSIRVLNEVGTNCPIDEVRELATKALVRKNVKESLEVVIKNKGKGINDLSAHVAMSSINELLALKDKNCATLVLDETINSDADKEVIDTARSVKALMSFSA